MKWLLGLVLSLLCICCLQHGAQAVKFELSPGPDAGIRRCLLKYIYAETLVVGHFSVSSEGDPSRIDVEVCSCRRCANDYSNVIFSQTERMDKHGWTCR